MPLIWKLIFRIWDLVDSSSLPSGKVQSFIGTHMQKPLYDFSISKVMTVRISTFARICDFQPNANRHISIRFCHKYSSPALQLGLTSNFSHFPVPGHGMAQFHDRSCK